MAKTRKLSVNPSKNQDSAFTPLNKRLVIVFAVIVLAGAVIAMVSPTLTGQAISATVTCPYTHPNYKASKILKHDADSDRRNTLCDNCGEVSNPTQAAETVNRKKDYRGLACDPFRKKIFSLAEDRDKDGLPAQEVFTGPPLNIYLQDPDDSVFTDLRTILSTAQLKVLAPGTPTVSITPTSPTPAKTTTTPTQSPSGSATATPTSVPSGSPTP